MSGVPFPAEIILLKRAAVVFLSARLRDWQSMGSL